MDATSESYPFALVCIKHFHLTTLLRYPRIERDFEEPIPSFYNP